ncbi:hypothetical protein N9F26_01970 [Gammaproteobacteria bacterium]|jgi:hypothetical protein|nr:hypothetical protein [Gammaproteobacteria bacterium]
MSIWWDKYKFLVILVVFACFTYLLSDNQTANEGGKILDDEMFAEIQECITRNKIGFSKEIFEEGAEEQMIKNDIDRTTQQVIALCTDYGKETE